MMIKIFSTYYELLRELTKREIKQRYKQSILGYAWVILNPFFQMLVMAFVFSKIIRFENLGVPYTIYLYAGLLPWTLFSNSLMSSVNILINNSSLINKIYFPREIFIISTIIAKIVDYLLASTIFILFLYIYKIPITFNILFFIPIFFIQIIFMYSLSIILAALNLFYRDIQYLLSLFLLLMMYLTPVIYPVETMPTTIQWVFKLNPMAVLINAYRQVIFTRNLPNFQSLFIALMVSLLLYAFARYIFKKLEKLFADII